MPIALALVLTCFGFERTAEARLTAQSAIDLAQKNQFDSAFAAAKRSKNPVLTEIIEWYYVQSDTAEAGFERISAFSTRHPDWPRRETIDSRAELALYLSPEKPATVLKYFSDHAPLTGAGGIALARAYLALEDTANARKWVDSTWRTMDLSQSMEQAAMKEMGKLIDKDARRHRLSAMIYRQQTKAAQRAASYLSKPEQSMAQAAVAFLRRAKSATALYDKVPASLRNNPALDYARIYWNRKRDRTRRVREILLESPRKEAKAIYPEGWWLEQRLAARDVLVPGKKSTYATAYRLVSQHALEEGADYVDAEFMSGWIALRFLQEPGKALRHFRNVASDATIPETKARADYWLGRTLIAMGRKDDARLKMKAAAEHPTAFYGQLARDFLGLPLDWSKFIVRPSAPASVKDALSKRDTLAAIRLIAKTDERSLLTAFVTAFAETLETSDQRLALAEIVTSLGAPHLALRVGRIAEIAGDNLGPIAFPTRLLPEFKSLVPPVERALVYGLIRQESEFNPEARSWAGASGLMQIMPATAKMIARDHRQSYSKSRLVDDPAYNLRLGTALIHDLINSFNGSYIMAIAGYNAGPGRSTEWMKRFGDPRTGAIDPIDWIELIPFTETRTYVQKVLQNVQVYRAIFGKGKERVSLTYDLNRGSDEASASAEDCATAAAPTMVSLIECTTQ